MRKSAILYSAFCTLPLLLLSNSLYAMERGYSAYHDYQVVELTDGLSRPWGFTFLPGGDVLITEKGGQLRLIADGELRDEPVDGLPEVHDVGQGGLLDVILHPDFSVNHWVYLTYSKPLPDDQSTTAVIRGKWTDNNLVDIEEIFVAKSSGRGHYGSRMAFDPDGFLYVSIGDRQAKPSGDLTAHPSQDLSNHHGVIVRLNDDGSVPADNPFVDQEGALPEIWTYGHRNPQGMVVDQRNGSVWVTEHGPQGGDELNLLSAGNNYGWPVVGYGVNYGEGKAIHAATTAEGMENPVNIWVPSTGASGLAQYSGDAFPNWQGMFISGGLAEQRATLISVEDNRVVHKEALVRGIGRVRDVRIGPDGFVYMALDKSDTEDITLVRLEPLPRAEITLEK